MVDRYIDIHKFVQRQKELLQQELRADEESNATTKRPSRQQTPQQQQGGGVDRSASRALSQLQITDLSVGLYGRTVVVLTRNNSSNSTTTNTTAPNILPAHKFTVGDEVEIRTKSGSSAKAIWGVVSQLSDVSISVALGGGKGGMDSDLEQDLAEVDPPLSLLARSSVDVHNKLIRALDDLDKHGTGHPLAGGIVAACFSEISSKDLSLATQSSVNPWNENLDASQLESIQFSLQGPQHVSLIHGPPGTGKTTTVAELIYQATAINRQRVLVTAPSNVAVDNVLERLVAMQQRQEQSSKSQDNKGRKARRKEKASSPSKLKMVRIGHPARIKPSILAYSLESLVQSSDGTEIVQDVRQELQQFLKVTQSPKARWNDKRAAYREVKSLRKEVRQREEKVVKELVQTAKVVLCTNVGAANSILRDQEFDLVVIDEAAQALEASCWIPALKGKRLVLAGDHKQLPPTIKNHAIQDELGVTLFERIMTLYKKSEMSVARMLQVQYRMHEDIADWASNAMYQGRLQTFDGVKAQKLTELERVEGEEQPTLCLIDTAGCDMEESVNASGSRFNEGEAALIEEQVRTLVDMGLDQKEIAIISPYNGQVEILKTMLLEQFPRLEIRSVDGFQGGEREAVLLSLVRSNSKGEIGFLRDDRRLNVAVTRAKRHLTLVCDTETVSRSNFIQGLIDWIDEKGEHRSAFQMEEGGIDSKDLLDAEIRLGLSVKEVKPEIDLQHPTSSKANNRSRAVTKERGRDTQAKRKELLDRISTFADNGNVGDELKLSSDLSRYDRRLVHEFATQLGLGHESQGVDGVDRRMVIRIISSSPAIMEQLPSSSPKGEERNEEKSGDTESTKVVSSFAALMDDDDDDDDDDHDHDHVEEEPEGEELLKKAEIEEPNSNSLLAQLARERERRKKAEQSKKIESPSFDRPEVSRKSKKVRQKSNGQRLGSSRPAKKKAEQDEGLDDLDDMAFLEAQIEKVQNSHGRKVEGKGSYKTVVNGILLSKPAPRQKQLDSKSSSALNLKLKEAQEARRSKKGKKKR